MRAALAKHPWDLIIADYRLPEFDAPSALSLLHESGHDIPFIVVSGAMGEELAVAMMRAGAQDYLLKSDLARLAPAVEREMGDARTRRQREQAEHRAQRERTTVHAYKEPRCNAKPRCCRARDLCFVKSTIALKTTCR